MAVHDRLAQINVDPLSQTLFSYVQFEFGDAMPATFPTPIQSNSPRAGYWIRYY